MTFVCCDCGDQFPRRGTTGRFPARCDPCRASRKAKHIAARKARYLVSVKGRETMATYSRALRSTRPEVARARDRVKYALRTGRLVRPDACEGCGVKVPADAHHHNGYDRAHALDVTWLCVMCHKRAHGRAVAA